MNLPQTYQDTLLLANRLNLDTSDLQPPPHRFMMVLAESFQGPASYTMVHNTKKSFDACLLYLVKHYQRNSSIYDVRLLDLESKPIDGVMKLQHVAMTEKPIYIPGNHICYKVGDTSCRVVSDARLLIVPGDPKVDEASVLSHNLRVLVRQADSKLKDTARQQAELIGLKLLLQEYTSTNP